MANAGWESDWDSNPTLLATRKHQRPGFAPYADPVSQSLPGPVSASLQGPATPLQQAMRAADIRTELEEMDRNSVSQAGSDSVDGIAGEAPQSRPSLEELLEAEMAVATSDSSTDRQIREDAALADLATHEVARACRDIVDDARTEAILNRISQKRREAAEILRLRAMGETSPGDGDYRGHQRSSPDFERDIPHDPPTRNFVTAFNARRLAYAAAMVAIMAGSAPGTTG